MLRLFALCEIAWNCCIHNKCMRLYRNLTGSLINLTIFIGKMQFFLLLHCLFSSKGWVCYTSFELIIRSVGDIKSRWQDHPSCHKSQQECLEGLMLILLIIIIIILMNTHLSFHTKYQPPKCWMRANEWSYTNKRKTNDYFSHFSIST